MENKDETEKARYYFMLGLENLDKGNYKLAEDYLIKSLNILPDRLSTLTNLSTVLIKNGKLEKANEVLSNAIALHPLDEILCLNKALLFERNKEWQKALESYENAIKINNKYVEAFIGKANIYMHFKNLNLALYCCESAINIDQSSNEAKILREQLIQKIKNSYSLSSKGTIAAQAKHYDQAYFLLSEALKINAENGEAYNNRAVVLEELKRLEEALNDYDKAIEYQGNNSDLYYRRALLLYDLKRLDESIINYDRSIELNSNRAEAYSNRGVVLLEVKKYEEALASFEVAIKIKNDYAEAYLNRGLVHQEQNKFDEALQSYELAIRFKSNFFEAYYNRGLVLKELKRMEEAIYSLSKAIELNPLIDYVDGTLLHAKLHIFDWTNYKECLNNIIIKINEGKRACLPFPILSIADSLPIQRKAAEIWLEKNKNLSKPLQTSLTKNKNKQKIRIGYYSSDFHCHATAYLMAELFELHDKERFEIIAFQHGPVINDEMRARLLKSFDKFIDVGSISDKEIALLSRDIGIDIAIDLKGFTFGQREGIFLYRAAPIQVNYLGYPGTMGSNCIDYIIADKILIPDEHQKYYQEKIVYLPYSYQVNDRLRKIADKEYTRGEFGLPKEGFVYCCFNSSYKILPEIFDLWVNILNKVDGSVLWLLEEKPIAIDNIRKEAMLRGLNPSRLIFAKRLNLPDHLARHKLADLFLDTNPYNAHTTASDALWAGLPVLTYAGNSFASRVAASLLNAIEIPELITHSQEDYVQKAVELAVDHKKLKLITEKLKRNKLTTPLFDTKKFTTYIEKSYTKMFEIYKANLPIANIYINNKY